MLTRLKQFMTARVLPALAAKFFSHLPPEMRAKMIAEDYLEGKGLRVESAAELHGVPDGSLDYVVCVHSRFERPGDFLRAVRPGGLLCLVADGDLLDLAGELGRARGCRVEWLAKDAGAVLLRKDPTARPGGS